MQSRSGRVLIALKSEILLQALRLPAESISSIRMGVLLNLQHFNTTTKRLLKVLGSQVGYLRLWKK